MVWFLCHYQCLFLSLASHALQIGKSYTRTYNWFKFENEQTCFRNNVTYVIVVSGRKEVLPKFEFICFSLGIILSITFSVDVFEVSISFSCANPIEE